MKVSNTKRLSYPGYNELFTGVADPRIDSNQYPDTPNVTVLESLTPLPAAGTRVVGQRADGGVPCDLGYDCVSGHCEHSRRR